MTTIYYADIASFEAGFPFTGMPIAMVKATQSTNYVNPDYTPAKARAAKAGAYFCAYHFLTAGNAIAQAQFAFAHVGKTIPLMLDWETTVGSSPSVKDAQAFVTEYKALGGKVVLLYLPKWYWQDLGSPSLSWFAGQGMFLVSSDYQAYTDDGPGWTGYGGMSVKVWQFSSTRSVNGYLVDLNAFKGTKAQFETLVSGTPATPPPPPVSTTVPNVVGKTAGNAHNALVSAKLVPTAASGQVASEICSSTNPAAGTKVNTGTKVTIVAATQPTIKQGDTGSNVGLAQKDLRKWDASTAVDSVFGPATTDVTKRFQAARSLTADGVIGPATWAKLGTL